MGRAVSIPAGTTDVAVLAKGAAAGPATLMGYSVRETAAGAATVQVRNGTKVWTVTEGGGTNEQQTLTEGGAGLESFTLTWSGQTTGAIAHDAPAADVEAALVALSNIGADDVNVTGNAGGPYTVEFTGALGKTNVAQMTATPTGGTGTVTVATSVAGEGLTSFTLTYNSQTTASIDRAATAATVKARLEALSNVGEGEAQVTANPTGPSGGPYTITFSGSQAGLDATMTSTPTGGTGTAAVAVVRDPVVDVCSLAANGTAHFDLPGIDCPDGLYVVREPGTTAVVLYVT